MLRKAVAVSAVVVLASACGSDESEEDPEPEAGTSPTYESTVESVEHEMSGDDWWDSLTGEQQDLILDGADEVCATADEELTYGSEEGSQQDLTYTREMAMALGIAGGVAAADEGPEVEESVTTLIMSFVRQDCPEHEAAIELILEEQGDVIFGRDVG